MSGNRASKNSSRHLPLEIRRPAGFIRKNLPIIRFVLTTIVILTATYAALKVSWVELHFVKPYTHFVAACGRAGLGLIGVRAGGSGSMVVSPEFSVAIKNVCNGLEVMAIFFATTIGFPATIKGKLLGLILGFPVIFLVNLIRVVVLFVLGSRNPQLFEDVHFYYAQAVVIIITVALWLLWVTTLSDYGSKARPRLFG